MLEITSTKGYIDSECYHKESWFKLDGMTGYCIREEGKYYPEIPAYTEIVWNGCTIGWDGYGYSFRGDKILSLDKINELLISFNLPACNEEDDELY